MSRNVAMKLLVNSKDRKDIGWDFLGCGIYLFLPVQSRKIVSFSQTCMLTDVKYSRQGINVEEVPR